MESKGHILFVDDEESMREVVKIALEKDGHTVDVAAEGETAIEMFEAVAYDMVIQDLKMPKMDGIELLRHLREIRHTVPVVILTAFSTWDTAVEAMRLGAYDYLKKPFDTNELRAMVTRALSLKNMRESPADTAQLRVVSDVKLIGSTAAMLEILDVVHRVAPTDSTVVITGESGTGKEMIARLLHLESHRRTGPFISVNCGAFSETLLESEIFGHLKGSFTGAVADKKGLLEIADGGSFFLDEVGEMSLATQVRLLRVLETREFLPVGGTSPRRADVRFLAATNRNLEEMVERGTFREDLYYRLNVIPIHLPPLRERREDVPLLAGHFLAIYAQSFGREIHGFAQSAMDKLLGYEWPGNVRELQNTIQRAVTLATSDRIDAAEILLPRAGGSVSSDAGAAPTEPRAAETVPESGLDLEARLAEIEAKYIRSALDRTDGNLTKAADLLGISFRSIRYKVKKLGVEKP